ncbi:ATP-binding protein [Achromobacter insolitus]|uniref:ATP-binding protein n=1 Tax=Achromobacter insolitus TaxID=217204 RepID=UPI00174B6A32|nr:ATP-binding protein [Achromobacter insolitus]
MVARTRGKPITVDTRPTKIALVNSLTRDISVEACVFDLIDNAVDAARDSLLVKSEDQTGAALPDSYAGYQIRLNFSGQKFRIADNCGGISVTSMEKTALRFGERSAHHLGIGIFGLGLNRALFKLGKKSTIQTDTGEQRSELVLNTEAYLHSESWDLPAVSLRSTGQVGTIIEIDELQDEIAQTFADNAWVKGYRDQISKRYGRFIRKGLIIEVNEERAVAGEVKIRADGPFIEEYKFYSIDGVSVYFQVGQHADHRFSAEPDYEKSNNAQLTEEYGWTVLCNDRAVIMSDRTWKTGWDTKFHTEFYGFVGVINFVSESPSELPWDTTKSDVDLNNRAYQAALLDMRKFAQKWRQFANQAKSLKKKEMPLLPLPGNGPAPVPAPAAGVATSPTGSSVPPAPAAKKDRVPAKAGKAASKNATKLDHNQFAGIIPKDIDEHHCDDKHLALVHEAKTFNLRDFPYSGMALIRILFEVSAVKFFDRLGKLSDVKQFVTQEREKKKNQVHAPVTMTVSLEEYLTFMERNPEIWGDVKAGHLQQAVRAMGSRKKLLNSVMHNPYQSINGSVAFAIRDEVLPILRHLIETPPLAKN